MTPDPGLTWLQHLADGPDTPLAHLAAAITTAITRDGYWTVTARQGLPTGWDAAWIYLSDQLRPLGWTMTHQTSNHLYVAGPPAPVPDDGLAVTYLRPATPDTTP